MAENINSRFNEEVRENQLDFLFDLYKRDVAIGFENIDLLKKHGYIKEAPVKMAAPPVFIDKINESALSISTKETDEVDATVDIILSDDEVDSNTEVITDYELAKRRKVYGHVFVGRNTEIKKEEWMPESTTEHTQDFVEWIDSINQRGFKYKVHYNKFALYVQQTYAWLQENKTPSDFDDDDEREDYQMEELRRCDENALYFLNKYVYYKEGDAEDESGRVKYIAAPAHEFLAYLDDCGYSVGLAKGRQMAATTTLMALDVRDVVFKQNHFMKFITEDDKKAVEIFEDKLKYAFGELPYWMRPNVLNERDNLFKLGDKSEKGKKEGVGSKIQVEVPKRTAVAGGAPQKVKIDEAGNIPILGVMIGNLRPTMLFYDRKSGKLKIKRRLWFWGTGGEMNKGGKAFETELLSIMKMWDKRDFSFAIIPIFLDWTCRPFATQEQYDQEKTVAYAKGENDQDPDAKKHITEFHQTWPTSLADVFRTSAKTLVDDDYINAALKRITDLKVKHNFTLHQSGYFEPIYDTSAPTDEGSDVPFKIIGSTFVPTSDIDARASTTIFMHPEPWENRYFQGTDPIDTYTGSSNMASTIWDKEYKLPSAILNWRVPNYPEVFKQTLLLGLYYDTKKIKTGVKELVESNRGTSYTQYKTAKSYEYELVLNYQLPHAFQNKATINEGVGIDNKGVRNTMMINKMFEMFSAYGTRFNHSIVFEQLKTFTCKVSENGKEMWGPSNRKYFMDDTLWSSVFSYICAELCFPELVPRNTKSEAVSHVIQYKTVRGDDMKLRRVAVKVKVPHAAK